MFKSTLPTVKRPFSVGVNIFQTFYSFKYFNASGRHLHQDKIED